MGGGEGGEGGGGHPSLAKPSSFSLITAHFLLRILRAYRVFQQIMTGLVVQGYTGFPFKDFKSDFS